MWHDPALKSQYSNLNNTNLSHSDPDYGVLEKSELLALLRKSEWGMGAWMYNEFNTTDLEYLLGYGPVLIGYYDQYSMGHHVNVICAYDSSLEMCAVMEPRKHRYIDKGFTSFTQISGELLIGNRV